MSLFINNRYTVKEQLGQGGMATVYLVEDTSQDNAVVALKQIQGEWLNRRNLAQFKYEFAALKQLKHPNLVEVYDFGTLSSSKTYYFTMEYVEGEDFATQAQKHLLTDSPDYEWLYQVLVQLARALQYLHARGFIHYDIKPHNIRITPAGQVKLMDFGLIERATSGILTTMRGTPEYMAPEVVRSQQVDHRADFYGLGVTLYQITTGHLPYENQDGAALLKAHLEKTPPDPQSWNPAIPNGLQSLILKLMQKEPLYRYASGNELIQAINRLSEQEFTTETTETKRSYIQSGHFVGRDFELTHLKKHLNYIQRSRGRLVLVSGTVGVGKTRLLQELKIQAQFQNVLVLEGSCQPHASAPYSPWVKILQELVNYQKQYQPDLLSVHAAPLLNLIPSLSDVVKTAPLNPTPADKSTLMETSARLLQACDRPILIVLDNLHHADDETLDLLAFLGNRAPQNRWLICGLYRDDEVNNQHTLNRLVHQARLLTRPQITLTPTGRHRFDLLDLKPLSEVEVTTFIQSMLGLKEVPPNLVLRLMQKTGGNILFIESLLHSLVDEDLLRYENGSWQIDLDDLNRTPDTIQDVVQGRLQYLDEKSLSLLQWAAIIGDEIDLKILLDVTDYDPLEVFSILAEASQNYILNVEEQAGRRVYRFGNEQIREAITSTLHRNDSMKRHRLVAHALQKHYDDVQVVEQLAWHYYEAVEAAPALKYARLAADKARSVYANDLAIQQYNLALTLLRTQPDLTDLETEYEVLNKQEACFDLLGNRVAQEKCLDDMSHIAEALDDVSKQVAVANRKAQLYNNLGRHAEALEIGRQAVRLATDLNNEGLLAASLTFWGDSSLALGKVEQAKENYEEALTRYQSVSDRRGESEVLRKLGNIAQRVGQVDEAESYYKEALNLARTIGSRDSEALTLNVLGIIAKDQAQARNYYEQALSITKAIGDRAGQGRIYNNLGLVYWKLGLYLQARDYLEQAIILAQEMGNRRGLAYYLDTLGRIYIELESFDQAEQVFAEGQTLSEEIGDAWIELAHWFGLGRVALAHGQYEEAIELFEKAIVLERAEDAIGDLATTLAWLSFTYQQQGEWSEALQASEEAIIQLEDYGSASDYPIQDVWWLHYLALRDAPSETVQDDESSSETSSETSPETSEEADGQKGTIDDLSEAAKTALSKAYDSMMLSIVTLSDEGLRRNYLNKVHINRQILAEWTRYTRHEDKTQAATEITAEQEKLISNQVEGTLKRVLDISVRMGEFHQVERLFDYTMNQVIELSGAERGFLVLLDEAGRLEFKTTRGIPPEQLEEIRSQISYTVIGTVAQTKAPVLLQDALTDERFSRQSSVLDLSLRSVLCVPLLSRGRLIGLIYIDNRSVSGRFSQADVDLMTIFTNQAAIAIENALLYEETAQANKALEEWAHTLEERVNERTAELQKANAIVSRHATQLQASSEVGQRVTSILDADRLLSEVVRLIQERFGYYFVSAWLVDKSGAETYLQLKAWAGQIASDSLAPGYKIPMDTPSVVVTACQKGTYQLVNNVSESPEFLALAALPRTKSELALPLLLGENVIGVLDIQSDVPESFSPEDQLVLQTLANQIAIALNNAQLYNLEKNRRHFSEALAHAGRTLSSSLDMRQVPDKILAELAQVVPYERGSVWLQAGEELQALARRGFPQQDEDESGEPVSVPITPGDVFEQVVSRAEYTIIDDIRTEAGWKQLDWLPENRSWLGVPLIAKGKVIGMVSLTRTKARAFSPDDGRLVQAFAGQAAIALENARLYEEITQFNEKLEQLVQARTDELEQAYHTLERLDQAKADFISVASHELRTPLTVINGYAQLLLANTNLQEDDPNASEMLDGIRAGAVRMQEVVNSMLDVTKIDSKTLRLHAEEVMLAVVIERARKKLADDLKKRQLTFRTYKLASLPLVQGDIDLLLKVFYQLIVNAIKYTPDGGKIVVRGSVLNRNQPDAAVEVVVEDTGIGIEAAQQKLIFEKFYQTGEVALHSSGRTTFKGGGPGLGLAIARGIVVAHGGEIWVESPGHDEENLPGSAFHVRLPVYPSASLS